MSAEASTEVAPVERPGSVERARVRPLVSLFKNLLFFGFLAAVGLGYETGYFSNDRISRGDWNKLYGFPKTFVGKPVYQATFTPDVLKRLDDPVGTWEPYNNALPETLSVQDGALTMKYSLAWLGVHFNHKAFQAKALYRVRFEAKVDGEPAAILMRNRQLDYMRQQLPTTAGAFKEFAVDYAAPAGRFDEVKVIFMPDGRDKVSGSLTLRNFRIERLEK